MAGNEAGIGDDFLTEVLRGAKDRKVEIEMLDETYQEALRLAAEAGWEEGEALLGVFASGVAYLRTQLQQARVADGSATHEASMRQLAEHCMQVESQYAVLKFRAYGMAKDRQVLELHVAGLRPDNEGMRARIAQFREEVAGLKAEVERLREENRQLKETPACCVQPGAQACEVQEREDGPSRWLSSVLRRLGAHRG